MTLPNCWVIFLASALLGSMTYAQPHMTGRAPKPRHLVVTEATAANALEVRVAPGHLTSVTFGRRLTPEGVKVEDGRERLKRLDVTESHLTVEPAAELGPGDRLLVTVSFPDGGVPGQVVLALVSSPSEVDTEVTVSRLPTTMGEVLAELNATRARLAEAHQQLQAQRSNCASIGLTERMFAALGQGEGGFSQDVLSNPTSHSGLTALTVRVHRSPGRFILGLRFRVTASAASLAPWTPHEVQLNHRGTGQQVKVLSLEMRPPHFSVGEEVFIVMELEPRPLREVDFQLRCGKPENEPLVFWNRVLL